MIVPVYNQEGSIVENVRTICRRVAEGLAEPFEVIVVSDGSIDRTEECLLETRSDRIRVIHYDRNLGKGYAVKIGSLAAGGEWISFVDADLDIDPGSIPLFLDVARKEELDFAIGSKRHPESIVGYPRSRRTASWLYQQLVRVLFRLDVRDTQVGLKVYRREVAEQVMPLLIVKRYAFDLELLAVSGSLGFDRIRELPIRLDYQFTGSGVRSMAVFRALLDTAAVFYRLRVLRYYRRKRAVLGDGRLTRALDYHPLVSLIASGPVPQSKLDYPFVETIESKSDANASRVAAARMANGEVLAFLGAGAIPAGNWLSSTVPFLSRPEIAAVAAPTIAPAKGSHLHRAAAAVWESRLGGGSLYFRFTPGNLRFVRDFPGTNLVVRRADFLAVASAEESENLTCARLNCCGKRVVYTPESVIVAPNAPLFRPHLKSVGRYARARAEAVRRGGIMALRPSTLGSLALLPALGFGLAVAPFGGVWRLVGLGVWAGYAVLLAATGSGAALRYRSLAVGVLATAGLPATHVAYATSFVSGLLRRG